MRTLILGGARSGKSRHAETLAAASGRQVVYLATAQPTDEEMAARIAHHRKTRPASWATVEAPLQLGAAIAAHAAPDRVLLVDCLTVWLGNLLFADGMSYPELGPVVLPARVHTERAALLDVLGRAPGEILLVSNEVGLSITPMGAISRAFVDQAGLLNQVLATRCERVTMVMAGLPMVLKGAL